MMVKPPTQQSCNWTPRAATRRPKAKKITALEAELAKTREKMEAMETTIGELATMLRLHFDKQQ